MIEARPVSKEKPFNVSHLSGEARFADRQVTKDAAKAMFDERWPEVSADLKRRHHREMFMTAARRLLVPPDRADKAFQWLLENGWLKLSRVRGEYLPGEESPRCLRLLEEATAPAEARSEAVE